MSDYSYDRSQTKKASSLPTLKRALSDWMNAVAKEIAAALPAHLKADGVKINPGVGPSYAGIEAKGYTRSDLESRVEFGLTINSQPFELRVFASFEDVTMTKANEQEFTLSYDDDINRLTAGIARWLKDL